MVTVGPVTVSFTTQFFTIGTPGQTHLHFYLDGDLVPYRFYDGPAITDDNGVLYNGVHTHFVHWKSATSFDIFGLSSASHTVRVILADQSNNELTNAEATKTHAVTPPPRVPEGFASENRLITAADIRRAHHLGQGVRLARRTLITPLARELAARYGVDVLEHESF